MTDPGTPKFSNKGSQRWLQVAVNRQPDVIDMPLKSAIDAESSDPVPWLSPLAVDRFCEYRDQACLRKLEVMPRQPLAEFWPARGAMWDGLARVHGSGVVLVEAKAHIR